LFLKVSFAEKSKAFKFFDMLLVIRTKLGVDLGAKLQTLLGRVFGKETIGRTGIPQGYGPVFESARLHHLATPVSVLVVSWPAWPESWPSGLVFWGLWPGYFED
jgi:hypothetical protein